MTCPLVAVLGGELACGCVVPGGDQKRGSSHLSVEQWSPTPELWAATGPWAVWYRAAHKSPQRCSAADTTTQVIRFHSSQCTKSTGRCSDRPPTTYAPFVFGSDAGAGCNQLAQRSTSRTGGWVAVFIRHTCKAGPWTCWLSLNRSVGDGCMPGLV